MYVKHTKEEDMIKLVAVDLDGTFLNNRREVSKKNIEMIKKIQAMGIKFVANTGRTYEGVQYVLDPTQIQCDCICMNGGAVYDTEGKLMKASYMDPAQVKDILNCINQKEYFIEFNTQARTCVTISKENAEQFIRGWMALYNNGDTSSIDEAKIVSDIKRLKNSFLYVKDIDEIYQKGHKIIKITISHKDRDKIQKLREKFSQNPKISVAASFHTNIEITDVNADKGSALETFVAKRNIKMEEVMAFGDSLNDYSMLKREFGYTVAMGNAIDKIKNTAKYQTKTNEEDGVAYFINKIVLNNES
ncbi:HAD family hydrolase [Lachnotalea glycerini]|uniref:HAD family hydrolase n=2 Tax=Lachnotalea glycerini TaxID=1763509 RepID=A0A371JIW2_9FIRM|nr:HAD family hydrolase [Lachnotalea glycerini]